MDLNTLSEVARILGALVGGPLAVEFIGYWWHRSAEHDGVCGDVVRYRHYMHHEVHYPLKRFKSPPGEKYRDSHSWSWYAIGTVSAVLTWAVFGFYHGTIMVITGFLYGQFVINYMHEVFHLSDHPLHRWAFVRRLTRLHILHHMVRANYGILFFGMDRLFGTFTRSYGGTLADQFPGAEFGTEISNV